MTSVTTYQVEEWFTADDLDAMGDDERYELLDGELFVVPSPTLRHQRVSAELHFLLRSALPAELRVVAAPMDVRLEPRRQVQPDLLVVPRALDDAVRVEEPPLLVVEILSRGTRGRDQTKKRRVYEQAGVPSFWLVDPDVPALTVLELSDGSYVQVARVEGNGSWTAQRPFPVTVSPAALLL
jgi:Uma2 family endonuclease